MRPHACLAWSVLVLLTLLAGCGEDRGASPSNTTPRPLVPADKRTIVVSLTEYRLTPAEATTFDAVNDGDSEHALAVEGPRGDVRTRVLAPGEHATIKVMLPPGSYKVYCPLADHERHGMVGAISRSRARRPSG
jgi:plastocyanin